MSTNTRNNTMSEEHSDVLEHSSRGTPQESLSDWGLVTVMATILDPFDHDRYNVQDNACLATPVQPDWNVLKHSHAKTTSVVACATEHPSKIEVNVYRENTPTADQ